MNACTSPSMTVDGVPFTDWVAAKIDSMQSDLQETFQATQMAGPNAQVAVLGYPHLFPDTEPERSCAKLTPFLGEQTFLNEMGDRLNGVILASAYGEGVSYLSVVSTFENHEVCAEGGEWIYGPALNPVFDLPPVESSEGAFHPNLLGHSAYANVVNSFLETAEPASAPETQSSSANAANARGSVGQLSVDPLLPASPCVGVSILPYVAEITGQGFDPDSTVEIRLFRNNLPTLLRTAASDDQGRLITTVSVPLMPRDGQAFGFEARGSDTDGHERVLVDALKASCE